MEGDPLIELRRKYAEDLEEILQCPVCFECLEGPVPLCMQGHHVCIKCQPQIHQCPLCKSLFNGTRNYLAENLVTKFQEIKVIPVSSGMRLMKNPCKYLDLGGYKACCHISLIDPRHSVNERIVANKRCIETQTDPNEFNGNEMETITLYSNFNNQINVDASTDSVIPPSVGKGKYPCKIGNCKEEFPHGRMISHIRYHHEGNLIDVSPTYTNAYSHKWNIEYKASNTFDRVIQIHNMGIFFIKVFTDETGNLYGNVQIVNTRLVAQGFQYQLEIGNDHTRTYHKGIVLTCRTNSEKVTTNCLFIHSTHLQHLLKRNDTFDCFLKITRSSKEI